MSVKNLWGDLSELEIVRTPKAILNEQASLLTKATKGILVGDVEIQYQDHGQFEYNLNVCVPTLNGYTYTILSINHKFEFYPIYVHRDNLVDPISPESVSCRSWPGSKTGVFG